MADVPASTPLTVDVYGAQLYGCEGPLDDGPRLEAAAIAAAEAIGATILEKASATYQPHGVTVALVLAESHLVIATWPEFGYVMVDMMLCNDAMDPAEVTAALAEVLRPTEIRPWRVPHHIGPSPVDTDS